MKYLVVRWCNEGATSVGGITSSLERAKKWMRDDFMQMLEEEGETLESIDGYYTLGETYANNDSDCCLPYFWEIKKLPYGDNSKMIVVQFQANGPECYIVGNPVDNIDSAKDLVGYQIHKLMLDYGIEPHDEEACFYHAGDSYGSVYTGVDDIAVEIIDLNEFRRG